MSSLRGCLSSKSTMFLITSRDSDSTICLCREKPSFLHPLLPQAGRLQTKHQVGCSWEHRRVRLPAWFPALTPPWNEAAVAEKGWPCTEMERSLSSQFVSAVGYPFGWMEVVQNMQGLGLTETAIKKVNFLKSTETIKRVEHTVEEAVNLAQGICWAFPFFRVRLQLLI